MNRKDVTFRPWADADGSRWECFVHDGFFSYSGYGKTQEEAWRAADSPDLNDADCLTGRTGFITGPTIRGSLGQSLGGVVVTELGDGGAYFAPPGDFSKVDFSACQVRPEDGVTLTFSGPKGSPGAFWTCRVVEDGILKITGYSEDPNKALEAARVGHLKMPSYGPVNEWPIEAASPARHMVSGVPATGFQSFARMGGEGGFLDPNTLPNKADTKPKTAQQQAKPALPSLMTEAGERYRGLGWCDE